MPRRPPPPPFHRSGSGTPLVLIHGFTGTWRIWEPLFPALEHYHDVVAITQPGHRGGPPVGRDEPVSIALLADGLERTLDDLGIGTAHIVGNSLGGWLSLELARRGRARSVVGLSPAGGWGEAQDLARTAGMIRRGLRAGSLGAPLLRGPLLAPQVRQALLRDTMARGDRMPAGKMLQMIEDAMGCTIKGRFMAAAQRDGGFHGDMSAVTCPIRIAWGQNDRLIPADQHGRPLLDRVPSAEFVVMPGVGHVPMYDDPLLVTATILEVTRAVDAAALAVGGAS